MNGSLDIALSGLRAAQLGIEVSSHNISNVSVDGYTRARVNLAAVPTNITRGYLVGGGVEVASVQRISDQFINAQIRNEGSEVGYYDRQATTLSQIETVLSEAQNQGLSKSLSNLFSSLSAVASSPETYGERSAAINAAQLLAGKFQSVRAQLVSIKDQNKQELDYTVDKLNANLDRLASLNAQIASGVKLGDTIGSLQDERDRLLVDVTKAMNVQTFVNQDDASASVSIDGMSLLLGETALHLQVTSGGIVAEGSTVPFNVTSGSIGAMLKLRSTTIPSYIDNLDTLANSVITQFNTAHYAAYGLDGVNHRNLFTGTNAYDMSVNTTISADPNKLAASSDGTAGDNGGIEAMLALRTQTTTGGTTFEAFHGNVVGAIGSEVASAKGYQQTVTDISTQLQNQRDSVSAVSLDEEMANLIRFQQAYNASARVINIVNEMLDTTMTIGR